ncbi:MAG: hypothetical protein JWQ32_2050 [Marmoricola sp.]|nr:hypothetical protein [Marmoricola sp.]
MPYVVQMSNLEIITTAEAAEILRVSVKTVHRWAGEGRLAVVTKAPGLRGARFFLRSQVEQLGDELATTPGAHRESAAAS